MVKQSPIQTEARENVSITTARILKEVNFKYTNNLVKTMFNEVLSVQLTTNEVMTDKWWLGQFWQNCNSKSITSAFDLRQTGIPFSFNYQILIILRNKSLLSPKVRIDIFTIRLDLHINIIMSCDSFINSLYKPLEWSKFVDYLLLAANKLPIHLLTVFTLFYYPQSLGMLLHTHFVSSLAVQNK